MLRILTRKYALVVDKKSMERATAFAKAALE